MQRSNRSLFRGPALLALLASSCLTTPAWAQDTESPVETENATVDNAPEAGDDSEIVITALKRATNLQDTPYSISALGEDTLEKLNVTDLGDLVGSLSGLSLREEGPGQSRLMMRGLQAGGEPLVGLYYNEAPTISAPGPENDAGRFQPSLVIFDVDRIEVLRGPQGTLYGAGSMGGTVRIITNKPDATALSGRVNAEMSHVTHGELGYQLNGMLNVPIVSDRVGLRVVGYARQAGGFVDNVQLGVEDANRVETFGGRAALKVEVSDRLSLLATAYYQDQKVSGGFHVDPRLPRYQTQIRGREPFDDKIQLYNLELDYSADFADIVYSLSYFDREALYQFWSPLLTSAGVLAIQPQPVDTWTHELRFSSKDKGPLQWTAGIYHQKRKANFFANLFLVDPVTGKSNGFHFFERKVDSGLKQTALFGEVTWNVTDRLVLTGGARWFDISTFSEMTLLRNFGGVPIVNPVTNRTDGKEDGVSLKAHASYEFSDDITAYAIFSQGFRAGGANQNLTGLSAVPPEYGADSIDNYEIGARTAWLDGKLTFNVAAYHIDWNDIQTRQTEATGLFGFLSNGGKAKVDGLEAELALRSRNVNISVNANWTNARLVSDSPLNIVGGFSQTGVKGDHIPDVPRIMVGGTFEYVRPLNDRLSGSLILNGTYVGQSNSDFHPFLISAATGRPSTTRNPSFVTNQGDYGVVDLKLRLFDKQADWDVTVYADNLFNRYATTRVLADNFRPSPGYNFIIPPRTFGISFTKGF